jgi:hypothetical protein
MLNRDETKGERREEQRRKRLSHKTDGASVKLLWRIAVEKAKRLEQAHDGHLIPR